MEKICGCCKESPIIEEYDRKILVRHQEIVWNINNQFEDKLKEYDFEIKAGDLSAWIEISHPYINLIKFNSFLHGNDVILLKKYFSLRKIDINSNSISMNKMIGYHKRKIKDNRQIKVRNLVTHIIGNMDLISDSDLEMIVDKMKNIGVFYNIIKNFMTNNFGTTISNDFVAKISGQNSYSSGLFVKHDVIPMSSLKDQTIKNHSSGRNDKQKSHGYITDCYWMKYHGACDVKNYIYRKFIKKYDNELNEKIDTEKIKKLRQLKDHLYQKTTNPIEPKPIKKQLSISCMDLDYYDNDIDKTLDHSPQSRTQNPDKNFMKPYFEKPTWKIVYFLKDITSKHNEYSKSFHDKKLAHDNKSLYDSKGTAHNKRRYKEYELAREALINKKMVEKKIIFDKEKVQCLSHIHHTINEMINTTKLANETDISEEEYRYLREIQDSFDNMLNMKELEDQELSHIIIDLDSLNSLKEAYGVIYDMLNKTKLEDEEKCHIQEMNHNFEEIINDQIVMLESDIEITDLEENLIKRDFCDLFHYKDYGGSIKDKVMNGQATEEYHDEMKDIIQYEKDKRKRFNKC